jgi:hypothetical protein
MMQEETRPGEEETTPNERTKKKEKRGEPGRSVREHTHCGKSKRAAS